MKLSLSVKVAGTVIALVALGGTATAYLVYKNTSSALQESITSRQLETTRQTMDKIDRFLYERTVDVQQISGREQVQAFLKKPSAAESERLVKQLNDFGILVGAWVDMTLLSTQGSIVLTTDDKEQADLLSKQNEFKEVYSKALAGHTGYSDLFLEKTSDEPLMLFMSPVRDTTKAGKPVIGVMVGKLAWPSTLEILEGVKESNAELINIHGVDIGSNEVDTEEEILKQDHSNSAVFADSRGQSTGSGIYPGLDDPNEQYLSSSAKESGYLSFQGNGWTLVLETPKVVAYSKAQQLAKNLGLVFLAILAISIVSFLIVMRTLVLKPITNLSDVMKKLSHGDFSMRASIVSKDELGQLGEGFNNMADKMQFAYMSLKERTAQAENDKRTLNTLIENLPVGVHVVNAQTGDTIMMNSVGVELVGRPAAPGSKSGNYTKFYDVIRQNGQPYPEAELPMNITLREGKTVARDDIFVRRPDGSVVQLKAVTTPIRFMDGTVRTAVGVFEDVTKERMLERSRDEFFSIASHELRTPLTAIRGNSSLISQYFGDSIHDPDFKEMVTDINESAQRLITIVNDFLDTSRLEQNRMKYQLEAFDLPGLAEEVVKEYQVTGSRHGVELKVEKSIETLPKVFADKNRTKQVLINLVGNAIKFTSNGSVTISFSSDMKYVKTLVKDTGHGMSMEAQGLLFRKFEQAGNSVLTRDSVRGTGLGLYISKMITEQMHGHIQLESSKEGAGTTFSFELPIAKSDQISTGNSPQSHGHPSTTHPTFGKPDHSSHT